MSTADADPLAQQPEPCPECAGEGYQLVPMHGTETCAGCLGSGTYEPAGPELIELGVLAAPDYDEREER